MRILLVQPAPFEDRRLGLENTVWMSEPVGLCSVASMARPHDEVRILDLRIDDSSTLPEVLRTWRPDIVGTTAMTTDAYQALATLKCARSVVPEALTIIGGHHPTLMPEFFRTPFVDVIVKGEGELVFEEILKRWEASRDKAQLVGLQGAEVLHEQRHHDGGKSPWVKDLDTLPAPRRDLIAEYTSNYFYILAQPMGSIFTSRGCSFDCNFCAIWEFYDRKTRFLSAKGIADRMEAMEQEFVFLLDDNFLSRTDRLWALADELESRGIKKYWMSQGRSDFVAKNPELMHRLASVGMTGLLSGYESNAQDALEHLRKRGNVEANVEAARILKEAGIISTGIFMVRPEFEVADFHELYDYIKSLGIAIPMVTVQTPLPGTELWKARKDQLLTQDFRLFDLVHPVVPTRLPRDQFYAEFVKWKSVIDHSVRRWFTPRQMMKRPDFYRKLLPNLPKMIRRRIQYHPVHFNPESYLRDEAGIIPRDAQLAPGQPSVLDLTQEVAAK